MITKLLKSNDESIDLACNLIKNGKIFAMPTETVYGLAADATNQIAVENIFKAKGRPSDNPLIVHISNFEMLKKLVLTINDDAKKLADAFWPGPLTIIMPKSNFVCNAVSTGLDSIGVRMPKNKTALTIIEKSNTPLAAPSANLSGKPSPTTAQDVFDDMNGKIPLIIDDGDCQAGIESTVISVLSDTPIILRPGIITKEQIEQVLNKEITLAKEITNEVSSNDKVLSPGMKYKHYSPNAEVILIKSSLENFVKYISNNKTENCFAMCFSNEEQFMPLPAVSYGNIDNEKEQAHNIFKILRELDKKNAKTIFVRCPNTTGISLAIYNRLIRSAGFKIIEL